MLVGQSLFQSLLTRLDEEDQDDKGEPSAPAFRLAGLNAGLLAATADESTPDTAQMPNLYMDLVFNVPPPEPEVEPEVSEPEPPPVPAHLLRVAEPEIAEDLGIGAAETAETLAEKRRRFAKDNHPDLVPEAYRDNATLRMKTANLLIDRAIKDLYWRSS